MSWFKIGGYVLHLGKILTYASAAEYNCMIISIVLYDKLKLSVFQQLSKQLA